MWWNKKCKAEVEELKILLGVYRKTIIKLENKLVEKYGPTPVSEPEEVIEIRKHHTHLSKEEKKELVEAFKTHKHLSKHDIAKYYNISYSTLCRLLREAKVS